MVVEADAVQLPHEAESGKRVVQVVDDMFSKQTRYWQLIKTGDTLVIFLEAGGTAPLTCTTNYMLLSRQHLG